MADEEMAETVAVSNAAPEPEEDVKMEEDGNEEVDDEAGVDVDGEGEADTEPVVDGKLGRDHYNAMRNVVEIVNTHKITLRGEE